MSRIASAVTAIRIRDAVAAVDDPEYPGISIVDLGLLESIDIGPDGDITIGLIPTFSGCPALAMIADEVHAAVSAVNELDANRVEVRWLNTPAWTVDRISKTGRDTMAQEFTLAVRNKLEPVACPRCGDETTEDSLFGSSRCRAIHLCPSCAEVIEVMRSGA
ncbi:MAG TPA: phenylacetate-CoA oxygenase subunit PaaJ [Acidimicrobiaceae bacterium]|nr:phenylacetate-CoA oxygenase subunit PaaJ [Acidimicrobiaceae bacterium]HAQ22943.1 phenylacetate-CoA oxygenase subunit PaaJ [Acidimicrobiaceae bacterium]HCV33252.1 phenylacetate-CoA oxygenase subunit PaaJ [Acidimicrobiaceae bacterium]